MITYLEGGWYTRMGQRRLRNEVVDGAIDTAGMLFRAAVPPEAISSLALKVRTLASVADPPHRRGAALGPGERAALTRRLQEYTDRFPALQSFINDCLEHINDANDLRALYLHLMHVTQMAQLLMVAKLSGAAGGLLFGEAPQISMPPASLPNRITTEASSTALGDDSGEEPFATLTPPRKKAAKKTSKGRSKVTKKASSATKASKKKVKKSTSGAKAKKATKRTKPTARRKSR